VFAWGAYGGMLKRAIALMKYENHPEIARPLGEWLGEAWMLNLPQINCQPVVVPIPLHPHKLKQRGYNQALLIAESFCDTTNLKLKPNGLERVRETKAQYGLTVSERQKNLAEAFYLGRDFRYPTDTPVLIIDDIYTTGATARSAVQLLHEHNVPVYGLVTVATTIKGR
jgi:ComF family protein